ncbi:MAG: prepilin-type N-terminal cleavage/methylation domain-containing protein [Ruthenibacterium sp.]
MKNKKGFTLIELIVVLAILAVIAAIAVPTAFGSIEKANVAADKASIEGLNSAIRMAAVIEKGDATIDKAKATTITTAITAADFDTNSAMLSNGGVDFIAATDTAIAHFAYKDGAVGTVKTAVKDAKWFTIATGDAICKDAPCNYYAK